MSTRPSESGFSLGSADQSNIQASIYIISDCIRPTDAISRLTQRPPNYSIEARTLEISWDDGLSEISTAAIDNATLSFTHQSPSSYWLKRDGGEYVAEFFLNGDSSFKMEFRDGFDIFLGVSLSERDGENSLVKKERNISIGSDDFVETVHFYPKSDTLPNTPIDCQNSRTTGAGSEAVAFGGLLIRVSPLPVGNNTYRVHSSYLQLDSLNGWLQFSHLTQDELIGIEDTPLSFFTSDSIISSDINGEVDEGDEAEYFTVSGHISARILSDDRVIFSGRSDKIWRSGILVNNSWWASLATDVKIALIGWVGALIWLSRFAAFGAFRWAIKPYRS